MTRGQSGDENTKRSQGVICLEVLRSRASRSQLYDIRENPAELVTASQVCKGVMTPALDGANNLALRPIDTNLHDDKVMLLPRKAIRGVGNEARLPTRPSLDLTAALSRSEAGLVWQKPTM